MPADTVAGAVVESPRLAAPETIVLRTELLLLELIGSGVVAETVAVAVIEPVALAETFRVIGMVTLVFAGIADEAVHTTEDGSVHVQPAGAEADTKVVLAGIGSVNVAPVLAEYPLLVTVLV